MPFVNTVDLIGDEALAASIIEKSIVEIDDNIATIIGIYAFSYCTKLTRANFATAYEISNYAFSMCNALTEASIPMATKIGERAFLNCSLLTGADFPIASEVGQYAFSGCKKLANVNLPAATSLRQSAFENCTALAKVKFPVLSSSDGTVFKGCTALTEADFGAIGTVQAQMFYGCSALRAVILRVATMCTLRNTSAFTNTPIASGTGYIYVPRALVDSYKAATNWSTYAAQFRALEDYTVDGTTTGELDPTKI